MQWGEVSTHLSDIQHTQLWRISVARVALSGEQKSVFLPIAGRPRIDGMRYVRNLDLAHSHWEKE